MGVDTRTWSVAVTLLGLGTVAGALLGRASIWWGVALAAVGLGFSLVSRRRPPSPSLRPVERPTLAGLGTRVEQVLRLAEEQANAHRGEAKRDAEQIVAAAQAEADAILADARARATRIAGTPGTDSG